MLGSLHFNNGKESQTHSFVYGGKLGSHHRIYIASFKQKKQSIRLEWDSPVVSSGVESDRDHSTHRRIAGIFAVKCKKIRILSGFSA